MSAKPGYVSAFLYVSILRINSLNRFLSSQFPFIFLLCLYVVTGCQKPDMKEIGEYANTDNVDKNIINPKPNIILILGDDIGSEVPGYNGGESYETPNLNIMAKNGMVFNRCHSSPLCSPSRFMLLTGKYNFRNYNEDSWGDLDRSQKTIANMLKENGYATCVVGKWQLNGGDTSIRGFGFDHYRVTNPFKIINNNHKLRLYKNPTIYQDGKYLPESQTSNKYGEDMCREYMESFMEQNRKNPFFIFWSMNLCHKPFAPTPDDPEFASWNPDAPESSADTVFFPSMVKYFDKQFKFFYKKLFDLGLDKNTLVLYISDNGTLGEITSVQNGKIIKGGKAHPIETGINVPMIAIWPGIIPPNSTSSELIDFVDFMPTFADIGRLRLPNTYKPNDGVSFASQLVKRTIEPRKYGYCWFDANRFDDDTIALQEWSLDTMYKYYDNTKKLYNYIKDPKEKSPISESTQTQRDSIARVHLKAVISKVKK